MNNEKLTWSILDGVIANDTAAFKQLRDLMQVPITRKGLKWGLSAQAAHIYFNNVCSETIFTYKRAKDAATDNQLKAKYLNCEAYFQTVANRHLYNFIWETYTPVRIPTKKRKGKGKEFEHPNKWSAGGTDELLELAAAAKLPLKDMEVSPKIFLVYQKMLQLSEKCRELIRLHYLEDYKWIEIASQRGKKDGTITKAGHDCVKKLKALVDS